MKTMQLDTKIVRVNEDKVSKKVSEGWKFVPKSLWKETVRDVKKINETPTTNTQKKNTKKNWKHKKEQNKTK